jgi:hypothetical protein
MKELSGNMNMTIANVEPRILALAFPDLPRACVRTNLRHFVAWQSFNVTI